VDKVLKKVKPFRDRFPEYRNHQLYLGLASMVFDEDIEDKCRENGIAVIKQVGDMVEIHDENLKTFQVSVKLVVGSVVKWTKTETT
jgi:hypothetical protein